MASAMMVSSAAAAAACRAAPAQTNMATAFNGLRPTSAFPVTRRANVGFSKLPSNGGRVQCMSGPENEDHKTIKEAAGEVKKTAEDVREKVNAATDKGIDKVFDDAAKVEEAVKNAWGSATGTTEKSDDAVAGKAKDA